MTARMRGALTKMCKVELRKSLNHANNLTIPTFQQHRANALREMENLGIGNALW